MAAGISLLEGCMAGEVRASEAARCLPCALPAGDVCALCSQPGCAGSRAAIEQRQGQAASWDLLWLCIQMGIPAPHYPKGSPCSAPSTNNGAPGIFARNRWGWHRAGSKLCCLNPSGGLCAFLHAPRGRAQQSFSHILAEVNGQCLQADGDQLHWTGE